MTQLEAEVAFFKWIAVGKTDHGEGGAMWTAFKAGYAARGECVPVAEVRRAAEEIYRRAVECASPQMVWAADQLRSLLPPEVKDV